jgi:hypothetical protein
MSFDHFIRIALESSLIKEDAKDFYQEWERILGQYPSGQFGTFLSNHDLGSIHECHRRSLPR